MATLYEEVAGVAVAELMSAGEGTLANDRYEDAKYYAEEAFSIMDAELPDLDPETDPPLSESKRAAVIYTKRQLAGQDASLSKSFSVAIDHYARAAIQTLRQTRANSDDLVDEDARLDMFK